MKYISYSLWGDKPIYNIGIIRNVQQAKTIYPEWRVVVYYDDTVPKNVIIELKELGVLLFDMTNKSYGMFWRFFAADIPDCEYAIFRDADSRLSIREKLAVDEWINSGKSIHVMRDHPAHKIPFGNNTLGILGGMWGIKGNLLPMEDTILKFSINKNLIYGIDQTFLKKIYTIYNDDKCVHDDFFEKIPFPIKRENGRFIGERININEQPLTDDYKILL
jgi:hypothetical protein